MRPLLLTTGILLLFAIPLLGGAARGASGQVVLDSGPVQGLTDEGVRRYPGIPYAAPPVGERRWRPPQPVAAWTEPRQAVAFGPAARQTRSPRNTSNGQSQPNLEARPSSTPLTTELSDAGGPCRPN